MELTGAKAVMEALVKEGVDTIFGYPGGAIMPVYDALYDYEDKIRHVLVRHEQGAGHAAEGYARMMGRPGVALVTSGPGATNLVTPIADAMLDSVPIVCITGQVHTKLVGTDAFQETDVIGITTPITKWNYQITHAEEIPAVLAKAFYIAGTGRPGPVVIDITKSAQVEKFTPGKPAKMELGGYKPLPAPDNKSLKDAAVLINSAKRPFMLIGHGVHIAKAEKEVLAIAEKTGIPVGTTLHGLSAFSTKHPLYAGLLGMHGRYSTNMLTNQADVIIAVGMRFDDRVTGRVDDYAKKAKVIHVDIDKAELGKNVAPTVAIAADAKVVLARLLPLVKKNKHTAWIREFQKLDAMEYQKVTKPELAVRGSKIKMAQAVDLLSKKTKGEAVIVADVGQHQMITARYYQFAKPNSFITSGGLGTMGFALPASMGAKIAKPTRQVVAVIGDGCFQMTIQELATIAQEELPVKILLLNNNYLGMVRQWQELFFEKRYSFVDLKNPEFVEVTKGFHIDGEKVTAYDQLSGALDRMLTSKKPYLLDVVVEKEENVFPMVPSGAACDEIVLE